MKHPINVEGFNGSLEELVDKIGKMRFDALAKFLELFAENLQMQADADSKAERSKLANQLYSAAFKVYNARDRINEAYKISKPYMKDSDIKQ